MEFIQREEMINELQQPFPSFINRYGIDDIGIFEEEGQDENYYLGYTVKKNGKTYHIHTPYQKAENGKLAPLNKEWTVETDEPRNEDRKGYQDLESALRDI